MDTIQSLELRGMSRTFGGVGALTDFTLEIAGGMFVTLLGPSGCGKTTALNCLAGLLSLSAGEIVLNGQPIQHIPAEKRGFGMVFQNYALFPHLTVSRNVGFGLETRHIPKSEREDRIRRALELVHLDEAQFGARFPAQLSGGQQQRLAFARTIVLEPNLLLLDEPLSNLDTKLRNEMRIEIKRLHKQLGLTTIYVTHDQSEALSLSDLIVVMRGGRIEQVGKPPDIYNCPRSLYVADFMGYSNKLPVTLVERTNNGWLVRTDAGVTLHASSTAPDNANWGVGEAVLACSRPDETLAVEKTSDAPNILNGIVHLSEYVGKAFELVVRMADSEHQQILVQSTTPIDLERPVTFSVAPDRLLLFSIDPTDAKLGAVRPAGGH